MMENKGAYTLPEEKRNLMVSMLSEALKNDAGVIFAYLYGSFLHGDFFGDVDVCVFIRKGDDPLTCRASLAEKLYETVNDAGIGNFSLDDFDVTVINDAPYDFAIDLLSNGL